MLYLTEKDINITAKTLRNGGIVAFPTETVYGLGVIFDDPSSFNALVAVKKRHPEKPFALMCSSVQEALAYVEPNDKIKKIFEKFLPGELTFLVNARRDLPTHVTLGTNVIGIRVPSSSYVKNLIAAVGKPCLVTSANISGKPTSKLYADVLSYFDGKIDAIVEGECDSLVPSTIVDLSKEGCISLIRQGAVDFALIKKAWEEIHD